jgi:hypothetical protein
MLTEIVRGTKEWNPSSIPFFTLLFALIAANQIKRVRVDGMALIAWAALGALLAILVSLHASTLYVMPVVFIGVSLVFIACSLTRLQAFCCVVLSLLVAGACLTPYWYGEIKNSWTNSRVVVALAREGAVSTPSLQEKIKNSLRAYRWLDGQCYFLGDDARVRQAGLIFLFLILILNAALDFRGDRALLGVLACMWIVFLCAAAQFPAIEERFRLPIVLAPVFLTICSLAFLDYTSLWGRALGGVLLLGVAVSAGSNVLMDIRHASYLFGSSRLIAVSDTIDAFEHIPYNASVCDVRRSDDYVSDRYIDEYVTHRNLRFSEACAPGTYQIAPKRIGWSGSDFLLNHEDYEQSYLFFVAPFEGPRTPPDATVIENTDVLEVLLRRGRSNGS